MMDADVVADKVNRGHAGGALAVDRLEQLDELDLTLTAAKDASDLTGARVKRSEEVQRAFASVFVLDVHSYIARLGGSVRAGA